MGKCRNCGTVTTLVCDSDMCVDCYNTVSQEASTEEVIGKALGRAKDAFFRSLEESHIDGIYYAIRFECMELSSDLKDVICTTTYDNIERKLTK